MESIQACWGLPISTPVQSSLGEEQEEKREETLEVACALVEGRRGSDQTTIGRRERRRDGKLTGRLKREKGREATVQDTDNRDPQSMDSAHTSLVESSQHTHNAHTLPHMSETYSFYLLLVSVPILLL